MLLLPDQTYGEESFDNDRCKEKSFDNDRCREKSIDNDRCREDKFSMHFPHLCDYQRRRKFQDDDMRSVTSMCEEFLLHYGVKREFFCKYRDTDQDSKSLRNRYRGCKYRFIFSMLLINNF